MYHLHVRQIRKTSGGSTLQAAQYISRTARYKNRGDVVRALWSVHMPCWVNTDHGASYWQEADMGSSRANARSAYTVVVALPKALTDAAQHALVAVFVQQLSDLCAQGLRPGAAVPMTVAIHEGGHKNPHVHLLVSTSVGDGIERAPGLWFKRYNAQKPENGGARRSRFMGKKKWLLRVREMWASVANQALQAAGLAPTLSHLSHAARQLMSQPALHLGPSAAHLLRQGKPAPRVQRYLAAGQENQMRAALHERMAQSHQRLLALEEEADQARHARLVWQQDEARSWQALLARHPLSGALRTMDAAAIRVLVTPASNGVGGALPAMPGYPALGPRIHAGLPSPWLAVQEPGGLWLVRPNVESVVRVGWNMGWGMGGNMVVSDATDPAAMALILWIAQQLEFDSPVVQARQALCESALMLLADMKENWAVRVIDPPTPPRPFPKLIR